ncbi:UDP-glycosyltransferase family, conserved site [Sesbania bispinosa]|nr:UDP-glycosyltransferase family, conserved site [Sesbania bispinosa]
MSLFHDFANATVAMQPHFEQVLETLLPRVTFMVTDAFLWWTLQSATRFGVPRFAFNGMCCYSACLTIEAMRCGILDDESVSLTRFPCIKLSKEDFDFSFVNPDTTSLESEFFMKTYSAMVNSYGVLVNSFYELEPKFVDCLNTHYSPKRWCVGPFCLIQQATNSYPQPEPGMKPRWMQWLDHRLEEKCPVLYVAFGSQAEISNEQLEEITIGLEESRVSFLWVIRKDEECGVLDGFEERVKERGMVTREWVDQREILMHESVEGFLSHCGWNSVIESICAGVPILAWPLMADQHLNAKMVEEELKVGFKVETRGFVKWEALRKSVRELMEKEKGREVRKKVREVAEMAKKAVEEGGSSWSTLESLLNETCSEDGDISSVTFLDEITHASSSGINHVQTISIGQ